jgi:O-acetyl-ADP-ribose deacetylase
MNIFVKKLVAIEGDITQQHVDAIVNAANQSLMAGGGVSGAIHRAAGLGLEEECLKLKWCDEGAAKITKGYNLPAKWVIHTVGPVWEGGSYQEDALLSQCYLSCFEYVEKYNIRTIAFPAISTGSYGFPVDRAARIAVETSNSFLQKNNSIEKILFVCFDRKTYESYVLALD